MKKFTKIALVVASFVLVAALSVGATLAWLTADTAVVENTFTNSAEVAIDIWEHPYVEDDDNLPTGESNILGSLDTEADPVKVNEYPLVPGVTLPKDPYIVIDTDSEPCYVYIEICYDNNERADNTNYITYQPNGTNWTKIEGAGPNGGDVYYYNGYLSNEDGITTTESVLKIGEGVQVNSALTSEEINAITEDNEPKVLLYGYAVQKASIEDALTAWNATKATFEPAE